METTLTMAGPLAVAGAARLRGASALAACPAPTYVVHAHQVSGIQQSTTWTKGAFADPTTFMVLSGKNRPTRPLLELSP